MKDLEKLDRTQLVGITEAGEVSFNLDVFDRLYNANIIITKRLTNKLIEKLLEHKDKIILHLTVTGYGSTKIEPFVPNLKTTHVKFKSLIKRGFPLEQCVLRVDPIIPTDEGIETARKVVNLFSDTGIKRVRFSILDMYEHVKKRFIENDMDLPFETFHAPRNKRIEIHDMLLEMGNDYGFEVEACGEPGMEEVSCLSQKDIDILGLSKEIMLVGSSNQRRSCLCPKNKQELIQGDSKAKRCLNKCLYCFWKTE